MKKNPESSRHHGFMNEWNSWWGDEKICNSSSGVNLASVIMGLDLRGKFCTILKFFAWVAEALNNSVCEIFECVWVALKFAVDQICPSWIPARFSGHSCSEAAAPIILLLTLSLYSVSSSNEQQQQLLFCAHDDPLFQGLELSTLFLLNIWLEEPFSRNTDCSYLNDLSHRQKTHTANWLQDCSEIRYKGVVICWLYIELLRQNYNRRAC